MIKKTALIIFKWLVIMLLAVTVTSKLIGLLFTGNLCEVFCFCSGYLTGTICTVCTIMEIGGWIMEYLFIYGLQIADLLKIFAISLLFITLIVLWFGVAIVSADYEDMLSNWNKWMKKMLITSLLTSLVLFMLPTKQTLLLMGGIYYGKKAINTVATSDKLEKVNKIIDLQLDKYIKELKNE